MPKVVVNSWLSTNIESQLKDSCMALTVLISGESSLEKCSPKMYEQCLRQPQKTNLICQNSTQQRNIS